MPGIGIRKQFPQFQLLAANWWVLAGWLSVIVIARGQHRRVNVSVFSKALIRMVAAALVGATGCNSAAAATPVVVVMIPVFVQLANRLKISASKFLIPLSYAAILGGTALLFRVLMGVLFGGLEEQVSDPGFLLHAAAIVPMLGIWLICRRGQRSEPGNPLN